MPLDEEEEKKPRGQMPDEERANGRGRVVEMGKVKTPLVEEEEEQARQHLPDEEKAGGRGQLLQKAREKTSRCRRGLAPLPQPQALRRCSPRPEVQLLDLEKVSWCWMEGQLLKLELVRGTERKRQQLQYEKVRRQQERDLDLEQPWQADMEPSDGAQFVPFWSCRCPCCYRCRCRRRRRC